MYWFWLGSKSRSEVVENDWRNMLQADWSLKAGVHMHGAPRTSCRKCLIQEPYQSLFDLGWRHIIFLQTEVAELHQARAECFSKAGVVQDQHHQPDSAVNQIPKDTQRLIRRLDHNGNFFRTALLFQSWSQDTEVGLVLYSLRLCQWFETIGDCPVTPRARRNRHLTIHRLAWVPNQRGTFKSPH